MNSPLCLTGEGVDDHPPGKLQNKIPRKSKQKQLIKRINKRTTNSSTVDRKWTNIYEQNSKLNQQSWRKKQKADNKGLTGTGYKANTNSPFSKTVGRPARLTGTKTFMTIESKNIDKTNRTRKRSLAKLRYRSGRFLFLFFFRLCFKKKETCSHIMLQ